MLFGLRMRSIVLATMFFFLVSYGFNFLLASRTKIGGFTGTDLHPLVMPVYFAAALFVVAILLSDEKTWFKITLLIVYSLFSFSFFVVVYDAGYGWDQWVHLGYSRRVYENAYYDPRGNPLIFSFFYPGRSILSRIYYSSRSVFQYSLSVIFARTFYVDLYWSHLLLIPISWGMFVPLICYAVAKALCGDEKSALLSSFLVTSIAALIFWGAVSVPQSVGILFYFFTVFLALKYLSDSGNKFLLPTLLSALASLGAHFVPGVLSFSVVFLVFVFKKRQTLESRNDKIVLIQAVVISASLLPLLFFVQRYFYPIFIDFSLSKLSKLSLFEAVQSLLFTEYGDYTLADFVSKGGIIDILGFLALVYGLLKPEKVNRAVCRFLFLSFLIVAIDNRIVEWFMVGVVGHERIWPSASLIAISSAGFAINELSSFLFSKITHGNPVEKGVGRRGVFRRFKTSAKGALFIVILVLSLAGLVTASVYNGYYKWMPERYGGLTGYDFEAAKYIDATTPGVYVVVCDNWFRLAGYAVVGIENPRAYYASTYDDDAMALFKRMATNPSPNLMIEAASVNNATFQYFVVSSNSPHIPSGITLSQIVEKASAYFDLYGVFGDEEKLFLYIFRYRTPPTPTSSDVSALFWRKPSSYVVQNDLLRVLVPRNESLEVRDFSGKLYEGLRFDRTLVDGSPLGNVSKVEYFDLVNKEWTSWAELDDDVASTFALRQQFRFRLLFGRVALVAIVERGKPFVQLYWESLDGSAHDVKSYLQTGEFELFRISGLTDTDRPGSVLSRRFGPYYTVGRTENVELHPAYNYSIHSNDLLPKQVRDYCNLTTTVSYFWSDLYVDNDAAFDQWVYVEVYLPDEVAVGVLPPFYYSVDGGLTWTRAHNGPLKTVNGTEVNWVISRARYGLIYGKPPVYNKDPVEWTYFLKAAGGKSDLPEGFLNSGGVWNRIIFGMYLLGDTNANNEMSSGKDEGDQVLIRFGTGRYGSFLDATYALNDSDDAFYGLRNMNDVFVSFSTKGVDNGGISFTKVLRSLFIKATAEDKVSYVAFNIPDNTTFSLFGRQFTESLAYESLSRLSYTISETDGKYSLIAKVDFANDWNRDSVVTICVPSNYKYDVGEVLGQRGGSTVLVVRLTNGETETVLIQP